MDTSALALFLLADGRFPAGGHAHSAGVEAAVADGRITDEASLEAYVLGRLVTTGLVDAALAAATAHRLAAVASAAAARTVLEQLDAEAEARLVPPALRCSSRRLGRQLARAAARCWPASEFVQLADGFPDGAHQSVVLGCVGVAIDAPPLAVAEIAVHHAITMPAQAGVRLLGLDPFGVAALIARLAPAGAQIAADAASRAPGPLADLPARSAPLADIAATAHATWEVRLFAT